MANLFLISVCYSVRAEAGVRAGRGQGARPHHPRAQDARAIGRERWEALEGRHFHRKYRISLRLEYDFFMR